jgi:hypothetical protein
VFGKISLEQVRRVMTREFVTVEQVGYYLTQKLYGYYDIAMERLDNEVVTSEDDYLEGLIDATSMTLIKCGIEYLDFETYVDKVETAVWKEAK